MVCGTLRSLGSFLRMMCNQDWSWNILVTLPRPELKKLIVCGRETKGEIRVDATWLVLLCFRGKFSG